MELFIASKFIFLDIDLAVLYVIYFQITCITIKSCLINELTLLLHLWTK